jgi:ABC-type Fe3+/spermidine/putrescine transport system ATPase subunit
MQATNGHTLTDQPNRWPGKITDTIYQGEMARHLVELAGDTHITVYELNPKSRAPGQTVQLTVAPEDVVVLAD